MKKEIIKKDNWAERTYIVVTEFSITLFENNTEVGEYESIEDAIYTANITTTTLLNLSNILIKQGYPDIFDYDLERDILHLPSMTGSISDKTGDRVLEFQIVKIGSNDYLDCIVRYNPEDI